MGNDVTHIKWYDKSEKCSGPRPRVYCHSIVVYHKQLILWGGEVTLRRRGRRTTIKSKSDTSQRKVLVSQAINSTIYAMNLDSYCWDQIEYSGTAPRLSKGHTAIVRENCMIVFGSYSKSNQMYILNLGRVSILICK